MNAVIRIDDRWIAGGWFDVGPTIRAAIWTSTDGIAWSDASLLEPEPAEEEGLWPRYWINGFGEWDGSLLAFGWNGVGGGDGGYPMLWRSADGNTWEVVETGGTAFGDEYHFPSSSVIGPDGSLVVFSHIGLGGQAATFVTSDLQSWEVHAIDEDHQAARMAGSPTHLIAVGHEQPPYEDPEDRPPMIPHAWSSTDGRTWHVIEPPAEATALADIAWDPTHRRFVAVGTDDGGLPVAWLTTDGGAWTSIPIGEEPTYMHRVVAAEGLIVASGETGDGFGPVPGDTIVWSSHDAVSWWYTSVLTRARGTVEAVTGDEAILVSGRWTEAGDESWLSLRGTLTAEE